MGADEVGTLRSLTHRRAILDRLIAVHRGRIANTAGDSVLAEFGSAVEAIQCAVEVQAALAEANSGLSLERHVNFRIGVHVGDVMVRGGDLFGDAVNIAARLEALAEPGGVCVSDDAYRQIRGKANVILEDLGSRSLKNISYPMRIWRVRMNSDVQSVAPKTARLTRRLAAILIADVDGYTSFDEAVALERLSALRYEIIEPSIAQHDGRLFRVNGDAFLAEFPTAVQAVGCAMAIQAETERVAAAAGDNKGMRLRIGVHVGDVITTGEDLTGDNVFIAARIESMTAAGGISITRAVHDQVRDWINACFVDMGEIALKNVARPMQVFSVSPARQAGSTDID
ncbi:adenylate/guanylate cyclase domain-containing protein [Bradyrhizobium arachidis]|nr:adenylate/guanylate cyclase domain-containing protein [Bradyrhizobium arachidis]